MQQLNVEQFIEMSSETLLIKLDELRQLAADKGARWAELNKEYKDIKEMLPSFLATIQLEYLNQGFKLTEARVKALADQSYKEKVMMQNEAEKNSEEIKAEYRSLVLSLECLKSIAWVKNNELKALRG